jgi:hypothetical protein
MTPGSGNDYDSEGQPDCTYVHGHARFEDRVIRPAVQDYASMSAFLPLFLSQAKRRVPVQVKGWERGERRIKRGQLTPPVPMQRNTTTGRIYDF